MGNKKIYWHKLPDKEVNKLIEAGVTLGEVLEKYSQPNWCNYPEALNGLMGCWSLTDNFGLRKKISKKYCSSCDCFKNKKK